MATLVSSGGQAQTDLFFMKKNDTCDGYDFYDIFTTPGTPAKVISPTRATGKPLTITEIVGSHPQMQDNGVANLSWDIYDSQAAVFAALDEVAQAPQSGALPEYKLENGTERGGTSDWLVLAICYLQRDESKAPEEIFTFCALGTMDRTSGSFDTTADDYVKPTLALLGSKAEIALTIPTALFDQHASDADSGKLDTEDIAALAPAIGVSEGFWRGYIEVPNA